MHKIPKTHLICVKASVADENADQLLFFFVKETIKDW